MPFAEVDVSLLVKITGPLNSEVALLSAPPPTRIERSKLPSRGLTTLMFGRTPISSPVTV